MKSKKAPVGISAVCAVALVAGLAACAPTPSSSSSGKDAEITSTATDAEKPNADGYEYGVITAEGWSEVYPNQFATYSAMGETDGEKLDYLEMYPALKTMYAGYAFSKAYSEPETHLNSLEDVRDTLRTKEVKQKANCITCKSPQYTAYVNTEGDQVNLESFDDAIGNFTENISCYNCHENDPETLSTPAAYWKNSMGDDVENAPMAAQTCGQCHNEYYFAGDNKVATNPYTGLAQMTPDSILAYYDGENYKDFASAKTGAPMIKVQHPEFEYLYGGTGSHMGLLGYSCADCHMGTTTADDGTTFTSHDIKSPLDNPELIENECSQCHKDLAAEVEAWQAELGDVEGGRTEVVSEKIEQMINATAEQYADDVAAFQAAIEAGTAGLYADGTLGDLQKMQREAQFYWDFAMNENSEGAHNPELARECLDKAESIADEALAKLGVA